MDQQITQKLKTGFCLYKPEVRR